MAGIIPSIPAIPAIPPGARAPERGGESGQGILEFRLAHPCQCRDELREELREVIPGGAESGEWK